MTKLVRPFGPAILVDQVSDDLVDVLNRSADRVLADPELRERWDWSRNLAGNVDSEVIVLFESLEERERAMGELREKCLLYFNMLKEEDPSAARARPGEALSLEAEDLEFHGMWLVSQKAGDFNPCHIHGSDFSSVVYIRLPPDLEEEWKADKEHYPTVGTIEFLDGRPGPFTRTMFRMRPRVGTIVVFPSWLPHLVYPFRSEGERRSVSFNMAIKHRSQ